MLRRTRIPFWTTIVTSLALSACLHSKEGAELREDGLVEEAPEATIPMADALSEREEGRVTLDRNSGVTRRPAADPTPIDGTESAGDADPTSVAEFTPVETEGDEVAYEPVAAPALAPPRPRPAPGPSKKAESYGTGGVSGLAITGTTTTAAPTYRPDNRVDLPPANSEDYTDYGVNGFVAAAQDHLSTFAVDVDTASYTVTRRKLREGYLPPESAVRVEEFVNYFPYEYRQPAKGDPFSVDFEATPSPWNPRNYLVRVGVQGKRVGVDERKPVHLTFLLDVSGSMRSADKLDLVKKSLIMLTEELEDGDTVAIATYAGNTSIVLEPTPVSQKRTIIGSLERLMAGGSTAMASGIDNAYHLADATYSPGAVNRVIICSDGDANVGQTSHEVLSKQIRQYAEKGITLTTLGFGNGNYKDTMMERLANDGDGNYFYIDSEIEARRVLVDKMTSTMEVIAKDVKIQVDWDPSQVIAYRLVGYENRDIADRDFRNDKVDAGEIGSGHQVTAIYEVALADDPTGTIATVRVRNKAPGPDAPAVERAFDLPSSAIKDHFAEGSDQFRIAVASASFAEILRGSPHMAEVTLRDVEAVARGAQRPEYREDAELIELIDRAAKLKGEGAYTRR